MFEHKPFEDMTEADHQANVKACFTEYIEACRRSYHLSVMGRAMLNDGDFMDPVKSGRWLDLVAEAEVDVKETAASLDHAILWHQAAGLGDVYVTSKTVMFPAQAVA